MAETKLRIYKISNEDYKWLRANPNTGKVFPDGNTYSWNEVEGAVSIKKALNVTVDNDSKFTTIETDISDLDSKTDNTDIAVSEINTTKLPELDTKIDQEISDRTTALNEVSDRVTITEAGISDLETNLQETVADVSNVKGDLSQTKVNLNNEIARAKSVEDGITVTANNAYVISNKAKNDVATLSVETDAISAEVFDTSGEGKISKLQVRADGIESTVYDPTHGLSTVEQKADSITAVVEDPDHGLSKVEQTAAGLSVTVGEHTTFISNQAATKDYVNSSIATNTATFQGTIAIADLGLEPTATVAQIVEKLNARTFETTVNNNDYCFVKIPATASASEVFKRFKYTVTTTEGTTTKTWGWEYDLNNSSFTESQWAAITSGITSGKVTTYNTDHTAIGDWDVTKGSITGRVGEIDDTLVEIDEDLNGDGTTANPGLKTTVSTHTSNISKLSTDLTGISGTVADHTSQLTTQAGAIAGKNTITKGDTAPEEPIANDLWFFTGANGYEDIGDTALAKLDTTAKYIDYYVKDTTGSTYILITVANHGTLGIVPKTTRAYKISGKQHNKWYTYNGTDWIETTDNTIAQVKDNVANLAITSDSITSRVSSTESNIDGLTSRVSEAESSIEQHTTDIAAKVSETNDGTTTGFGWQITKDGFKLKSRVDETLTEVFSVDTNGNTILAGNLTIGGYAKKADALGKTVTEYAQNTSSTVAPTSGWSTTMPTWAEDKYIWQRITQYDANNTQKGDISITCIQGAKGATGEDGEDAISYWTNIDSLIHTGATQSQAIIITAMKKVGTGSEVTDTDASIYINGVSKSTTGTYTISIADIKSLSTDIKVETKHGTTVIDTEYITYSPLNTPVVDLSNDSTALPYNGNTKIGTSSVSSTATLYLNGVALGASYAWSFTDCSGTASGQTVTVSTIDDNKDKATATVTATVTADGKFKDKTYTKVFNIAKQYKGAEGETGAKGDTGDKGDDAPTILSVTTWYYLGTSTPTQPTEESHSGWSSTPQAYENDKKYYTSDRTVYSSGTPTWSAVVENKALNGGYTLAQGKSITVYGSYSEVSAKVSEGLIKKGDCWFYTPTAHPTSLVSGNTYIIKVKSDDNFSAYSGYIGFSSYSGVLTDLSSNTSLYASGHANKFGKIGNGYAGFSILSGDATYGYKIFDSSSSSRSALGAFTATIVSDGSYSSNWTNLQQFIYELDSAEYAPNTLYQCTSYDSTTKTATWENIGGELVANKVTANFINALDITAKKINIIDSSSKPLFVADGISATPTVKIGGFDVDYQSLKYGTLGSANGIYLGTGSTDSATIGGSDSKTGWTMAAGSTFGVNKDGNMYATAGKIGGFKIEPGNLNDRSDISGEHIGTTTGVYLGKTAVSAALNRFLRTNSDLVSTALSDLTLVGDEDTTVHTVSASTWTGGGSNSSVTPVTDGGCFEAETLVTMADGHKKQIKDIKIGDKILAYNEQTKKFASKTVTHAYKFERYNDLVTIKFTDGTVLHTTADHPFLSPAGWKLTKYTDAQQAKSSKVTLLAIGDCLCTLNNTYKIIKDISIKSINKTKKHFVYNLTIDDYHTFIVEDIITHNIAVNPNNQFVKV